MARAASADDRGGRRRYDSPVRRQQAAETRERILAAGSAIAHELSSWDWRGLTFRAVAERAGVGESTVYRYFPTERHLHGAVMQRLNLEAGVDYDEVELATLGDLTDRILRSLDAFAAGPVTQEPDDDAFRAVAEHRQEALRRAVEDAAPRWDAGQRELAAAALDAAWNLPTYDHVVRHWDLDPAEARRAVRWLVEVVVAAVQDQPPPRP